MAKITNRIDNGYKTVVSLGTTGAIKFETKGVKPYGLDGGEAVDTTTMENSVFRTMSPSALKTLTEMTTRGAYAVELFDELNDAINVNQEITITFPDTSTLVFWGFLRVFEPDELVEGTQPEATITITPSNQNGSGVEVAPVYNAPA